MTVEEIDAIRQEKSRSWKKGALTEWYARKTVIRRAAKYLPRPSDKLAKALTADETEPDAPAFGADTLPAPIPARRLGSGTLPSDYDDARPAYAGPEPVRTVAEPKGPPIDHIPEGERDPYGLEGADA